MKINRFWGFFFNFVPGALHMYAGYMKQGLQLMGLFGISIIGMGMLLSSNLEMLGVLLVVPAVMFYIFSFFDGLRLMRNRMRAPEGEKEPDVIIVVYIKNLLGGRNRGVICKGIAFLLLFGGFISFVKAVLNMLFNNSFFYQIFHSASYHINNVVGSLVVLGVGYAILRYAQSTRTVRVMDEEELEPEEEPERPRFDYDN